MTTLKRTVDFVTLAATAILAAGLGYIHFKDNQSNEDVIELAHDVREFEQMIKLRAATKDVELNGRGWPVTIDPAWFNGDPPRNPLVSPDRPWVEMAPPEDAHLADPRVRIALDDRYASFWYNPYQGLVRARVPMMISDAQTLELYNAVNGVNLTSIHRLIGEPEPKAMVDAAPAATPAAPEAPAAAAPPAPEPVPVPVPAPPPPPAPDETSPDALDPTEPVEPAPEPPPQIVVPFSPGFPTNPASPPKPKGRGRSGG